MFFVKKPTGCVFPFQRSPLAKDYNRHAYQWLPAPLEAPKLPGEFTLNDGHHFFYANEVSKGDEIHIRWESQFFFKSGPIQWIRLFFVDLYFFKTRYSSGSCSLQFPGRGSESWENSWGASYSRSRIRFEVMSPEAIPPKKPNHRVSSPKWSLLQHCLPPKSHFSLGTSKT